LHWRAEFPHNDHVQLCMQRFGNFAGNRHAAPGQRENQRIMQMAFPYRDGQRAARIPSVGKKCDRSAPVQFE
jgi:hypothetical protein